MGTLSHWLHAVLFAAVVVAVVGLPLAVLFSGPYKRRLTLGWLLLQIAILGLGFGALARGVEGSNGTVAIVALLGLAMFPLLPIALFVPEPWDRRLLVVWVVVLVVGVFLPPIFLRR